MASAFKAKPAFGILREIQYQGDYILKKKSKKLNVNSYEKYLSSKKERYTNIRIIPINKSNIIAGLYYKMDLNNVCVIQKGLPFFNTDTCDNAKIDADSTKPFYQTNTIDPRGSLFGNSSCGTNNFTHYMELII